MPPGAFSVCETAAVRLARKRPVNVAERPCTVCQLEEVGGVRRSLTQRRWPPRLFKLCRRATRVGNRLVALRCSGRVLAVSLASPSGLRRLSASTSAAVARRGVALAAFVTGAPWMPPVAAAAPVCRPICASSSESVSGGSGGHCWPARAASSLDQQRTERGESGALGVDGNILAARR